MSRNYGFGREGIAPPEFGQNANTIRTQTIPLDSALNNKRFEIAGSALWAQDASDSSAEITVSFEDSGDNGIKVSRGFFMRGLEFSRIFVTATAQAGKYITLVHFVESDDNVQVENPAVAMNDVNVLTFPFQEPHSIFGSETSVAVGANPFLSQGLFDNVYDYVDLVVRANSGNVGNIYLHSAGAPANRFTLAPGESLSFKFNRELQYTSDNIGDGLEYIYEGYTV